MKTFIAFAAGVFAGLAFTRIPHYVSRYADHSLPKPEYTGAKAKMRYFNGGVEVAVTEPATDWPLRYRVGDMIPDPTRVTS